MKDKKTDDFQVAQPTEFESPLPTRIPLVDVTSMPKISRLGILPLNPSEFIAGGKATIPDLGSGKNI